MSVALIGLVAFQWYWINTVISANEEEFRRDVIQSMHEVVDRLEKEEAVYALRQASNQMVFRNIQPKIVEQQGGTVLYRWDDTLKNSSGFEMSFYFQAEEQVEQQPPASQEQFQRVKEEMERQQLAIAKKSEMVVSALEELIHPNPIVRKRIDPNKIDSLLSAQFSNRGITIPFDFGVIQPQFQRFAAINNPARKNNLVQSEFRAAMFPNDIIGDRSLLVVDFPNEKQFLLNKIWITMSSSGLLILLILFCFGYAVRTIVRQKKLSEMKSDFINNMTHELKTPVATIGLAVEALQDKAIAQESSMRERYLGVIGDENRRLGGQVERVLQMARIDRDEIKLEKEILDIHGLIDTAVNKISLQIESKSGKLNLALNASKYLVEADETHLLNVLLNLLDNSIKYSEGAPNIMIRTENVRDQLVFYVKDHGIGMSKEAIRHIFDKFYRVPTGNLHNVKGFGLGLPYVKRIVEEHGGKIEVDSEPGKGSNFMIKLPIVDG